MATVILLAGGSLVTFVGITVAATLPLIGNSLKINSSQLGVVLSAFVAGVGVFQILAGFGALKWGTREIYLIGLTLVGGANLLSGFSNNVIELAILRFVVGIGAALSSGTAFSLLASYYPAGKKGKSIGFYSGITNGLGGVIGLPAASAMGVAFGWSFPLEIAGLLMIAVAVLSLIILPKVKLQDNLQQLATVWAKGKGVLRSRSIWALSFGLAGFVAGTFVPIDYVTQYFSTIHPSWGITTAATIAAVGMGFTIPGGIVGGIIGEKKIDRRAILALCGVIFGACLLVLPYLSLTYLWFLYAIAGLQVGAVTAVMYIIPAYLNESKGENVTLGIGIINTTQFLFVSVYLSIFGIITVTHGFSFAWMISGLIGILLLPLLVLVSPSRGVSSESIAAGRAGET